jgi:hypothetical protein
MATRTTELKCIYCGRTITGDEYNHAVEEFKPRATEESREQMEEEKRGFQEEIAIPEEKHREEIEFLEMFYQTQNRMNQKKLLTQLADYEQELYEKDQYIHRLENETGGLKVPSCHHSWEMVL